MAAVEKWSDINPDWPDETIKPMGPNENHGTYEFFYEKILDKQDLVIASIFNKIIQHSLT